MERDGMRQRLGVWRSVLCWCAVGLLIGGTTGCATKPSTEESGSPLASTTTAAPVESEPASRSTAQPSASTQSRSSSSREAPQTRASKPDSVPRESTPSERTAASRDGRIKGLFVDEATFADDVVDRVPKGRLTEVVKQSQMHGFLWFWMRMRCEGECLALARSKSRGIPITVTWLPPGKGKGWTNKTKITGDGFRVAFKTANILPGKWRVRVKSDGQAVCTSTGECEFTLEVK